MLLPVRHQSKKHSRSSSCDRKAERQNLPLHPPPKKNKSSIRNLKCLPLFLPSSVRRSSRRVISSRAGLTL